MTVGVKIGYHHGCLLLFFIRSLFLSEKASAICSLVNEGAYTNMSCPHGQVVTKVDYAMFATFENSTSCLQPQIKQACPTSVRAQVELLCIGYTNCSVTCFCDADLEPACQCHKFESNIATGIPAFPCDGKTKQLSLIIECDEPPYSVLASRVPNVQNTVDDLRLAHLTSPVLGLDELKPQFSWNPGSLGQEAYKIDVYAKHNTRLVWTSGVLNSSEPTHNPSTSLNLTSSTEYFWRVSIWSNNEYGQEPTISEPAHFLSGLLSQYDWGNAQWIDAGICEETRDLTTTGTCTGGLLQTTFELKSLNTKIGRAVLFVSACQYYQLFFDGQRIGEHELDVVWTRFGRNRSYVTYNISTNLFQDGYHTIGLHVGQGFCGEIDDSPDQKSGRKAAILLLNLHEFGTDAIIKQVVTNSTSWYLGQSPLKWESASVFFFFFFFSKIISNTFF